MCEVVRRHNLIKHIIETFAESRGIQQAQLIDIQDRIAGGLIDTDSIDPIMLLVQKLPDPDEDSETRLLFEHQIFTNDEYKHAATLLSQIFSLEEAEQIYKAVTKIPSSKHQTFKAAYEAAVLAEHLTRIEATYILLARVLLEYSKAYRGIPGISAFF
jgi:hypothetical protein